jgi:RNA polymerase sigma-70 factor (ECF subfamily)
VLALRLAADGIAGPARVELRLDDIYRAHARQVASWASRLLGPSADLEDVVHEVFLVVDKKLASFRGEAKLTTWLYRITHNVARGYRRKAKIHRWLSGRAEDFGRDIPSTYPTPVEDLERRQAQAIVYRALDRMSEKYRTVFILFELEGMSGQEIAELLGIKLGAVWVRLHRARAQFEARIREDQGGSA